MDYFRVSGSRVGLPLAFKVAAGSRDKGYILIKTMQRVYINRDNARGVDGHLRTSLINRCFHILLLLRINGRLEKG